MAKQRYINTRFWDDTYISSLDPIEKLLFIYFITNPLTEISGAYEIQLKRVALDTGIDRDMVQKILNRFADEDRIIYRDGWIFVTNFIKHQSDNEKINTGIQKLVSACPDWIKDRVAIEYGYRIDVQSHSILLNRDSNTIQSEDGVTVTPYTGRRGFPRTMTPVNPSSDLELQAWLAPIAAAVGAKSVNGLPKRAKWETVCMTAIQEQRDLPTLLKIIESEKKRLGDDLQFFSPEICLQKLQMAGTMKTEKLPTLAEKLADDQANRQNLRKAPTTV